MARGTASAAAAPGGDGSSRLHDLSTEYVTYSPPHTFEAHMAASAYGDRESATIRRRLIVASGLLMAACLVLLAGVSNGWASQPKGAVDMVAWSNENDDGRGVLHGYQHGVTRVISNTCDPDDPSCTFHDSPIGYMAAVWTGKTKESQIKHPRYVQVRKDGRLPSSYEDQIQDGVDSSLYHSGENGEFHQRIRPAPQYHLVRLPMQDAQVHSHKFYNLGAVQDVDYEEEPSVDAEHREIVDGAHKGYRLQNADDRWRDRPIAGEEEEEEEEEEEPEAEEERVSGAQPMMQERESGGEGRVRIAYGTAPARCCEAPPEEEEERANLMQQLRQASKAVAAEGERYSEVVGRLAAVRSEGAALSTKATAARNMLLKWSAEEKKIAQELGAEKGGCGCGACCEDGGCCGGGAKKAAAAAAEGEGEAEEAGEKEEEEGENVPEEEEANGEEGGAGTVEPEQAAEGEGEGEEEEPEEGGAGEVKEAAEAEPEEGGEPEAEPEGGEAGPEVGGEEEGSHEGGEEEATTEEGVGEEVPGAEAAPEEEVGEGEGEEGVAGAEAEEPAAAKEDAAPAEEGAGEEGAEAEPEGEAAPAV